MGQLKHYLTNPIVSCGKEEDGAVLYNPDTDDTIMVNITGRELWLFLRYPRTEIEIVDHLLLKYRDVTIVQATEDTRRFLDILLPDFLQELNNGD